jgi:hypothetical protein
MDADALLKRLEWDQSSGLDDGGEAIADLSLAVGEINREITNGRDDERIRRLVTRLQDVGRKVANRSGARAFSISAGLPVGVTITVEWEVHDRDGQ